MATKRSSQMRWLDRLARAQHRDAQAQTQAAADHVQVREAEEREHLEREIRALIPSALRRLGQMDPQESGMQPLTYEVARLPLLGDRCGWRNITRAAWQIGQWTIPTSASSRSTPIWLLSNALIAYNGLDGEPITDSIDSIAETWPSLLPIIHDGLRERERSLQRSQPSPKSNPAN